MYHGADIRPRTATTPSMTAFNKVKVDALRRALNASSPTPKSTPEATPAQ